MKIALKSTLVEVIEQWLSDNDSHEARPPGLACENLSEMMADAAAAVYDASHAGAVMQQKEQ